MNMKIYLSNTYAKTGKVKEIIAKLLDVGYSVYDRTINVNNYTEFDIHRRVTEMGRSDVILLTSPFGSDALSDLSLAMILGKEIVVLADADIPVNRAIRFSTNCIRYTIEEIIDFLCKKHETEEIGNNNSNLLNCALNGVVINEDIRSTG